MSTFSDKIGEYQDIHSYKEQHWKGSFEEYLDVVKKRPGITRNAFQRIYDMIMSFGVDVLQEEALALQVLR